MSDAQLDELLDLAKPKLDPNRQKSLRRAVSLTLKSNRPSWWTLFRSNAPKSRTAAISLLVVGCCLLMLAGSGWLATPNPHQTGPVAVEGTSESDASSSSKVLSGSELARLYPPIISVSRADAKLRPLVPPPQKSARDLSMSSQSQIESSLLLIAGSDFGLMLVDHFANELDKATPSVATNRMALLNSRVRRSQKTKGLLKLKQQNERLQLLRQQLEIYLADAVERLPEQQATSAFRILCRVGSQASLPLILRYRNIETTQPDARSLVETASFGNE